MQELHLLFYSKLLTGIIYFYFLGLQTFMHDYQIFASISGFFTYIQKRMVTGILVSFYEDCSGAHMEWFKKRWKEMHYDL